MAAAQLAADDAPGVAALGRGLPEGAVRGSVVRSAVGKWFYSDLRKANEFVARLPTGAEFDEVFGDYAVFSAKQSPQVAMEFAMQISTEFNRELAMVQVAKEWLKAALSEK